MRKSKTDIVKGGVLAENQAKINSADKAIKAALDRKRKIIMESKLYIYGQLSELYGGMQGQALLDTVTAEHTLIGKLTDSGMSYADIEGLVDSSDGADSKSAIARTMMLLTNRLPSLKTKIRMRFNITDNKMIAVYGTAFAVPHSTCAGVTPLQQKAYACRDR